MFPCVLSLMIAVYYALLIPHEDLKDSWTATCQEPSERNPPPLITHARGRQRQEATHDGGEVVHPQAAHQRYVTTCSDVRLGSHGRSLMITIFGSRKSGRQLIKRCIYGSSINVIISNRWAPRTKIQRYLT
jgi:ABC-type dipeptide/oligopeptide/nickel transport system permease subunit